MQRRMGWLLTTIIAIVALIMVLVLYRNTGQPTRVRTMAEEALTHNKFPIAKKGQDSYEEYQPTKKDLANKNYVERGQLKKNGQYQLTETGLEQKWIDNKKVDSTVTNGDMIYHIKNINIIQNTARTQNSLSSARRSLNDRKLGTKFTTLVINYDVTNNNLVTAITPGITAIKYADDTTMSILSGIYNDGRLNTSGIVPYETTATTTTVLVPNHMGKHLSSLDIQFATVKDSANNEIVKPSSVRTITF